jgi:hypothetical protein
MSAPESRALAPSIFQISVSEFCFLIIFDLIIFLTHDDGGGFGKKDDVEWIHVKIKNSKSQNQIGLVK